jgi:hypothetical protein
MKHRSVSRNAQNLPQVGVPCSLLLTATKSAHAACDPGPVCSTAFANVASAKSSHWQQQRLPPEAREELRRCSVCTAHALAEHTHHVRPRRTLPTPTPRTDLLATIRATLWIDDRVDLRWALGTPATSACLLPTVGAMPGLDYNMAPSWTLRATPAGACLLSAVGASIHGWIVVASLCNSVQRRWRHAGANCQDWPACDKADPGFRGSALIPPPFIPA